MGLVSRGHRQSSIQGRAARVGTGRAVPGGKRARGRRVPLLLAALALAGCDTPLSTLDPAGRAAGEIAWLWWAMLGGSALLTIMVLGLVALGFRAPREQSENRWVLGMGIVFSLLVLSATLAAALVVGERILPRGPAYEVSAEGRQWAWRFESPETGATEGVMHIPAGQPVDVLVTSIDVIHSFWVPRLGGKIDAIPGRVNRLRLQVDEPGLYAGTCAEFCGLDHGAMSFTLIAHEIWPPAPEALTDAAEAAE